MAILTTATAQGDYLYKGQSGSEASLGASLNSESRVLAAGIGQSFKGVLDFGLAVGRGYSRDDDTKSLSFQPWFAYHFLKQDSASSRISAAFTASYLYDIYSSESLDRFGWRATGNHVFFGATVYGREAFPPKTTILSSISITYMTGKLESKDNLGWRGSETISAFVYTLGISVLRRLSPRGASRVDLGVSLDKETTTFSLAIGYLFIKPTGSGT